MAVLDNKIYVTGGEDSDYQPLSSVDCYDPDTNTWTQVTSMNVARSCHGLVSLHGRLYAIGGVTRGEYVESMEVYDPDNNTWTLLGHSPDDQVPNTGACLIKRQFLTN